MTKEPEQPGVDLAAQEPDHRRGMMQRHPNATVAFGAGAGLGTVVVWILGAIGLELPPEVAAIIAGALGAMALLIGRRGIKGTVHDMWTGGDPGPW